MAINPALEATPRRPPVQSTGVGGGGASHGDGSLCAPASHGPPARALARVPARLSSPVHRRVWRGGRPSAAAATGVRQGSADRSRTAYVPKGRGNSDSGAVQIEGAGGRQFWTVAPELRHRFNVTSCDGASSTSARSITSAAARSSTTRSAPSSWCPTASIDERIELTVRLRERGIELLLDAALSADHSCEVRVRAREAITHGGDRLGGRAARSGA